MFLICLASNYVRYCKWKRSREGQEKEKEKKKEIRKKREFFRFVFPPPSSFVDCPQVKGQDVIFRSKKKKDKKAGESNNKNNKRKKDGKVKEYVRIQ
jgi:hypothetical protein